MPKYQKYQSVHWLLLPIVAYFVLLAGVYAATIPIFEESDEAEHFLYVHNILQDNALPVIRSRDELGDLTDLTDIWNNHAHHAPLYYLLGASVIALTDRADIEFYLRSNDVIFVRGIRENNPNKWLHSPYASSGDTYRAVMTLRALNGLLGVGTLVLIFLTARIVWRRDDVAVCSALLVASVPGFVVNHASVTNDALVIFLYAAGTLWLVKTWTSRELSGANIALICLIVAGAALAKLTGLMLAGIVIMVLFVGAWRGHFERRAAFRASLAVIVALILLAGWWYVRNVTLYGDPFALTATQSIWGRDLDRVGDPSNWPEEVRRVLRSFWLMVGYRHEPLLAPDSWTLYGGLLVVLAGFGLSRHVRRVPQRAAVLILCLICVGMVAQLLVGTRNVDISYGRILFPAMPAFASLMAFGLWRIGGRALMVLAILPLIAFALNTPAMIAATYPRLQVLASADVAPDDLLVEQVAVAASVVHVGDVLQFDLTFAGAHPDNPYLLVTAVDSVSGARLGHAEVYPGMAATDTLSAEGRYRARVRVPLTVPEMPVPPRRVDLFLRWSHQGQGDAVRYEGAILNDRRYRPPAPPQSLAVRFGDVIALDGYELQADVDSVIVSLWWRRLAPIDGEWMLTVQMLDRHGQLVTQADGSLPGYPTRLWLAGVTVVDERRLVVPPDTVPDEYQILVGWYRLSDLQRLPVTSHAFPDQILPLTRVVYPFIAADAP
ncbi:MAG: phospholipid carrier-dependent glycosyltransferase [Anaerolineaceae bacterium]|nr:MAG: phospholipid carrier-dependent glycosyltransferase [Anaerolineaceae bacterium]